MKTFIKKLILPLAAWSVRSHLFKRDFSLTILMYHRILPEAECSDVTIQPGMVVKFDTFKNHLQWLSEIYEIVDLSEWCQKVANDEPVPKHSCALTFDDGWLDNYTYAYPELKRKKIPATIFLPAGLIGKNTRFWPEKLASFIWNNGSGIDRNNFENSAISWLVDLKVAYKFDGNIPTRIQIDEVISAAKKYDDISILIFLNSLEKINDTSEKEEKILFDWDDARDMSDSGIIRFGSHGMKHIRLGSDIDLPSLKDEVESSKNKIEKELGSEVKIFSYPNGDFCELSAIEVQNNYLASCTTIKGINYKADNLLNLKRIGVHQSVSKNKTEFLAKLSGLF